MNELKCEQIEIFVNTLILMATYGLQIMNLNSEIRMICSGKLVKKAECVR